MADVEDIQVLANLAAEQWPEVIGLPELVMHRENSVFRVETTAGPHALRLHRLGYHNNEALISELAWMDMLAESGMNVPRPMRTKSGAFLAEIAGSKPRKASLLSWLSGAPFGKTGEPLALVGAERTDMFFAIGAEMAKLHKLTDAWKVPTGFQRPQWDSEGLVGDDPFWGRFWNFSDCPQDDREWLSTLRKECRKQLLEFQNAGGNFGLIHADLVRENILVSQNTVSFIDFDDCGFGFRLFDIATALIKNIHEPDYENLQSALLLGYASLRPLPALEVNALPLFLMLRALTYLGWAEVRRDEPGTALRAQRFLTDAKYVAVNLFQGAASQV